MPAGAHAYSTAVFARGWGVDPWPCVMYKTVFGINLTPPRPTNPLTSWILVSAQHCVTVRVNLA